MRKNIKIGLFGFGCVGQGLYDVLSKSTGIKADIEKICVKDRQKKRSLPSHFFTFDKQEILENDDINLIVELIDDAEEAYKIVKYALQNGKNVVTANKKMVAEHLEELVALQQQNGTALLYEASACASIPIIRTLEEYYDNELLYSVSGIFNGSTNYILSKIFNENGSYDEVLQQAQELGFAESDPTLDVEAYDPAYKLAIIAAHSYGIFVKPENILHFGINNLSPADVDFARQNGQKIKLVAQVKKFGEREVSLYVMPKFVSEDDSLFNIENEYNAVAVEALFSDRQLFIGKGAGGHPTASAVLSDISACTYNYKYEYKKARNSELNYNTHQLINLYLSYEDEGLIKDLNFEAIYEKAGNSGRKSITGLIQLSELLKAQQKLRSSGVFVGEVVNRETARQHVKADNKGETLLSG